MKKIIFMMAVVALTLASAVQAQLGVQAGYDNTVNASDNTGLKGFHAGFYGEKPLDGKLSIQYGLLYNFLSGSSSATVLGQTITSNTEAHQLDLPVRAAFTLPLTREISAFVFGGPNFNYALSNTTDVVMSGLINSTTEGDNIYTFTDSNDKKIYNPFDVQIGVGGGIRYKEFSLRISHDWGMLDRDRSDNNVWKINDFKISLVYAL